MIRATLKLLIQLMVGDATLTFNAAATLIVEFNAVEVSLCLAPMTQFVLRSLCSRDDAHRIGAEIAAAVTEANPPPVTLKMEK
eukprot:scaffold649912_cov43-Prasinocladus_malaysianus.AAC.1